jgi:hypothetical protein
LQGPCGGSKRYVEIHPCSTLFQVCSILFGLVQKCILYPLYAEQLTTNSKKMMIRVGFEPTPFRTSDVDVSRRISP